MGKSLRSSQASFSRLPSHSILWSGQYSGWVMLATGGKLEKLGVTLDTVDIGLNFLIRSSSSSYWGWGGTWLAESSLAF